MACNFLLGSYFCYDNPGPLETQLEKQFDLDSTHFSMLYTVYSMPNMVLPILGGVFLDRIGMRSGLILFTTVLTIGQLVFAMGGYSSNFDMMLAGRIIFGMGGESMCVAQSSIVSTWFKGKELAFALGINMSITRLGAVLNSAIVPSIYDSNGLGPALMLGFLICCFSLANAFGLVYLDKKAEDANPESEVARVAEEEKFSWSDLYSFDKSFWILTGSCVLTYMSIFPYIQVASDLLQSKYHFDKITAGYMFGVPYIISAILSPILGLAIDRLGKRALLICMSSVILIIAYYLSMVMPECYQCNSEIYPLILVGVGYSIYAAAIWGSIPYIVKPHTVGTAFGLATAIQNIGLVISPTIVGLIKDRTKTVDHGYYFVNMYFIAINVIGLCLNISLYLIDIYENNSVLDSPYTSEDEIEYEKPKFN